MYCMYVFVYVCIHCKFTHCSFFARFRLLSTLQTRDWPLLFVTLAPPLCFNSRSRRPPLKKLPVKSCK